MTIKVNFSSAIDYILVFLLISLSGNNVFGTGALLLTFFLSGFVFFHRNKKLDLPFVYFLLGLTFILFLQNLRFDFYPWITIFGIYVTILTAYFIVKSVGQTFIEKYVSIMLIISLISLGFFVLLNIIPGLAKYLTSFALVVVEKNVDLNEGNGRYYLGIVTIIINKYQAFDFFRNHGPFWEAGAFAGYLMIALIFNIMRTGRLLNRAGKILIITILTTFSTTAYIVLFILMASYMIAMKHYKILKWLLLPVIISLGIISFFNLKFLGNKISNTIAMAQNISIINDKRVSSRFVDAVRDIRDFQGHELIGRGLNLNTRLSEVSKRLSLPYRTNGFTQLFIKFGSIFAIYIFFLLYSNQSVLIERYQYFHKPFAIINFFIIILLLQAETYFDYPLFWSLLFLYSAYINNEKENDALYRNPRIQ